MLWDWFWRLSRWDNKLWFLCALAFGCAALYAKFDEEFGDWLAWISRSYEYSNGVSVGCGAYTCSSVSWNTPETGAPKPTLELA